MATRVPSALLLLGLGLVAPLRGQHAAGVVQGFDGKPAGSVVVRAVDSSQRLLGEVLTTTDGRFELLVDAAIHSLRVQHDGVHVVIPVKDGGDEAMAVSFVAVEHFTLRGHLVDPGGAPAVGVDLVCRDDAGASIVTTTTDARGAFTIRSNRELQNLLVDPIGWRYVQDGPFTKDHGLAIDLRLSRDRYFRVHGRATDDAGRPTAGLRIRGVGEGQCVAWTTTRDDGNFALWCTRAISSVTADDGLPRMSRLGPWRAESQVDLDEREHGYVLVTGRLVDAAGAPSPGAAIYGVPGKVKPPARTRPDGATRRDGSFCVCVPRYQTHLWFWQEGGNRQAFAEIVAGQRVEARLVR